MNQNLVQILHKHFNWSEETCLSLNLDDSTQANLEKVLQDLDTELHLKPSQLLKFFQTSNSDNLLNYLDSCRQLCMDFNKKNENLIFKNFDENLNHLFNAGFDQLQLTQMSLKTFNHMHELKMMISQFKLVETVYRNAELKSQHTSTLGLFAGSLFEVDELLDITSTL